MRILMTGVSGQVGGALSERLAVHNDIIAATRDLLDLSRPELVKGRLDALDPDFIINAAAYTAVDKAEEESELAFKINAASVGELASWARMRAVPIIHFSTDYVFDGEGSAPFSENTAPNPLSVYGRSKAEGERLLKAAAPIHLVIRTSWVYAAEGRNFLRTIARLASERNRLRVVSDQFGAPTSARQIAECVDRIFAHGAPALPKLFREAQGLVHFAASGTTSWHGFACAIVEGLRKRGVPLRAEAIEAIQTADYPTAAKRPLNSRLDTGRVRQVFGVRIASWQDALEVELDALAAAVQI